MCPKRFGKKIHLKVIFSVLFYCLCPLYLFSSIKPQCAVSSVINVLCTYALAPASSWTSLCARCVACHRTCKGGHWHGHPGVTHGLPEPLGEAQGRRAALQGIVRLRIRSMTCRRRVMMRYHDNISSYSINFDGLRANTFSKRNLNFSSINMANYL
jgi:hypothetical protein